jgi:FixJ family two-component response regulator
MVAENFVFLQKPFRISEMLAQIAAALAPDPRRRNAASGDQATQAKA